jgi:YesN/AraC family two-component response regulator
VRPDSSTRPVVLAVDDEPGVREALGLVLQDDYHVVLAADGGEAIEILASRAIDVILLDLLMPKMDGRAVLVRIQQENRRTPVIVLSALADIDTIVASVKLGAWHYVTKPWQDELLLARVYGALRERENQPGLLLVSRDVTSLVPLELALERVERVLTTDVPGALNATFSAKAIVLHSDAAGAVNSVRLLHQRFPHAPLFIVTDVMGARRLESAATASPASVIATGDVASALQDLVRSGAVADVVIPHGAAAAAIRVIAARYNSRLTVTDVAHAVALSEHRLAHVFRDVTGLSVKDYIIRFRVAVGRRLLAETPEKVETISDRIGFADPSNFSRSFRQLGGLPPGEFRRTQLRRLR